MDLTQPDNPADPGRPKTSELTETATVSRDFVEPDVTYRPAPHAETPTDADGNKVPTWRVRFELVSDPAQCFGLEINGELVFGRGGKGTEFVDLTPYGADAAGVSRRHFSLRPTISNLYVVDERSTNGTILNGRPIGVANPASLFDRATLAAGKLQFYIRILERPRGHTAAEKRMARIRCAAAQPGRPATAPARSAGRRDRPPCPRPPGTRGTGLRWRRARARRPPARRRVP